jgi:tetratricopeptide (TPR) repeat protein
VANYPPHLPQSARFPGLLRPYAALFSGDFDLLRSLMDETVEACRVHRREWELAFSLQLRAKVNNDVIEYVEQALRDIAESRRIFERLGDEWGLAQTLSAEAEAAANAGEWERAAECCREGIATARRIGSDQHVPVLTVRLGDAQINAGRIEEGMANLRKGIEEAEGLGTRYGADDDGAGLYGKIMLSAAHHHLGRPREALAILEATLAEGPETHHSQPGFVRGMLLGMKGYLVGVIGDPEAGLALVAEGVGVLAAHPMANVITPRLGVMLAPGTAALLSMLAEAEYEEEYEAEYEARGEPGSGPAAAPLAADSRGARRAARAARLVGAHDRLRPSVMPPGEARILEATKERLRKVLGEDAYAAAHAEGGGLSVEEAAALMRDAD